MTTGIQFRYFAVSSDGDGPCFKVCTTPQEAYEYVKNGDFKEILFFEGEVMGMEVSSRGETLLIASAGSSPQTVYLEQEGEVFENTMGLGPDAGDAEDMADMDR